MKKSAKPKNIKEKLSSESQPINVILGAISDSACLRHKTNNMSYLQRYEWAENKIKRGAKQKQCPKCGRWYFRSEY